MIRRPPRSTYIFLLIILLSPSSRSESPRAKNNNKEPDESSSVRVPRSVCLGLQVKRGPQAAIHVKGHGRVLVDDPPGSPISLQADRSAHPETNRPSVRLSSSTVPVEAMAEGEVAAHRH